MNSTEFIKQRDQRDGSGWLYYVDLIESKDENDWFRSSHDGEVYFIFFTFLSFFHL